MSEDAVKSLAGGLASENGKKSTENLSEAFESILGTEEMGGWGKLVSFAKEAYNFAVAFSPVETSLGVISANLKSQTAQSTAKLMGELMTLMNTELVQAAIKAFSDMVNAFNDGAILNIKAVSSFLNVLGAMDLSPLETFKLLMSTLFDPVRYLNTFLQLIKNVLGDLNPRMQLFYNILDLLSRIDFPQWVQTIMIKNHTMLPGGGTTAPTDPVVFTPGAPGTGGI